MLVIKGEISIFIFSISLRFSYRFSISGSTHVLSISAFFGE
jgi:hypothetical protein